MNWLALNHSEQLSSLVEHSFKQDQVIFKHSTRCSISILAKNRLEKFTGSENLTFYYLDLLNYRALSNEIADRFNVEHASPQILLIRNGECIYDESHHAITVDDLMEQSR
jgi:bacillithiol system protein YtxJ